MRQREHFTYSGSFLKSGVSIHPDSLSSTREQESLFLVRSGPATVQAKVTGTKMDGLPHRALCCHNRFSACAALGSTTSTNRMSPICGHPTGISPSSHSLTSCLRSRISFRSPMSNLSQPDLRYHVPRSLILSTLDFLKRHGRRGGEGVTLWAGTVHGGDCHLKALLIPVQETTIVSFTIP